MLSDAEQIARLQRSISASQKQLEELKAQKENPESEFARAEAEFNAADKKLQLLKKSLKDAPPEKVEELKAQLAAFEKTWKLSKDRFDLAIEERKTLVEQITSIEQLIQHDRQAFDRLTGVDPPSPVVTPRQASSTAPAGASTSANPASAVSTPMIPASATSNPATTSTLVDPAAAAARADTAPAVTPATSVTEPPPTSKGETVVGGTAPAAGTATLTAPAPKGPQNKELVKAEQVVQEKVEQAQQAEREAMSITERLAILEKNIALEQKHLETARKQSDNASETRDSLAQEFEAKSVGGVSPRELRDLAAKIREAAQRHREAINEVRDRSERLDDLQSERADLLREQLAASAKAAQAKKEVEQAEAKVKTLQNPFAPRNLLQWGLDHGLKIFAILLAMILLQWLSRLFTKRVVKLMAQSGIRGSREERENRANTLVGVFHNAVSVSVYLGGTLMVLQEVGIPIAPLLGGAAVFGLAVAFGAQNLIRDYFYGFVILLENQYKLNDIVKIGNFAGQVERITLRMTVLRDLEGCVHFIPNGQITAVSNMTHGWSRALFEVGVAYKEDVDRVIQIIQELGQELRNDPVYRMMILEDLTMLGVDQLGDSAVVIKFFIKTRTLKQWEVKRELLRRIKNKFDAMGIEIPFPHRTVYHRFEEGTDLPESRGTHGLFRGRHRPVS